LVLGWIEFQIIYQTKNIKDPKLKLKVIKLASAVEDDETINYVNTQFTASNCNFRGLKVYLTKQVGEDNKHRFF
jgi:hypothetical protein